MSLFKQSLFPKHLYMVRIGNTVMWRFQNNGRHVGNKHRMPRLEVVSALENSKVGKRDRKGTVSHGGLGRLSWGGKPCKKS